MTHLQIYVIESLFARQQITKEQLIKAIDVLPETIKNKFLDTLIPSTKEKGMTLEFIKPGINQVSAMTILKNLLGIGLGEAKNLVYSHPTTINLEDCPKKDIDIEELTRQLQEAGATFRFI